jgi:hypothetical protein
MIDLLTSAFRLPICVLLAGLEVVASNLRELERSIASAPAHPSLPSMDPPPATARQPSADRSPAVANRPDIPVAEAAGARSSSGTAGPLGKENEVMHDTNLSDDMVKLVRYTIVSIKRNAERVIHHDQAIFDDNMTGDAFASWMIAAYLQSERYQRLRARDPEVETLAHGDKKYLRVAWEVLSRWPKQDLKFEENQLTYLRGIKEALDRCCVEPAQQASA